MSCYNDNTRDLGVDLLGLIEYDWVTQMSGGQENFEKWFRKAIQLECVGVGFRGRAQNYSCSYAPTITFVTDAQSSFASPPSQKLMRYSR